MKKALVHTIRTRCPTHVITQNKKAECLYSASRPIFVRQLMTTQRTYGRYVPVGATVYLASFHYVFLSVNHVNTALQSVKCFTLGDIAAHLTAVNGIYVDVFLNSLLIKFVIFVVLSSFRRYCTSLAYSAA